MESSAVPGRISHIFLEVFDLDRMLEFYRDRLGMTLTTHQAVRCAFLAPSDGSGPELALYAGRSSPPGHSSHWFLVFTVPDLSSSVAHLAERGLEVGPIEEVPFGRAAMLQDPEGNRVELHEFTSH